MKKYNSNESDDSPIKFPESGNILLTDETSTKEDGRLNHVIGSTKYKIIAHWNEAWSKLQNTFLHKIIADWKKGHQEGTMKESNESKIFVTRSSKEFDQFNIDEKDYEHVAYIYPIFTPCILAFPYAMKQCGIVLGTFLIFTAVLMLDYSEYLLVQCSFISDETSVPVIAKNLFGKTGYFVYLCVPYFMQLAIVSAQFILLADFATKVINIVFLLTASTLHISRHAVLLLLIVLVIPCSMTRNVKRIFKWSLLSLSAVTFVGVMVVLRLFTMTAQIPHVSPFYHSFKFLHQNILQASAIVAFVCSCQSGQRLSFMRVDINKDYDTEKPANMVSAYAILCSTVIAVCGYSTFNMFTQGNLLENYCEEDLLAATSQFVMAIFTLLLFPLECQNIRSMTNELVIVHQKFQYLFHVAITIVTLIPTFLMSLFIGCLPLFLELCGFLIAIPAMFILPQVLFLKLFPGGMHWKEKCPVVISAFVGVLVSILGLCSTFFTAHSSCIHSTALLPYCNGSSEFLGPLITLMSLNRTLNLTDDALFFNASSLEKYGFENLTDVVNAYLS